MKKKISVLLILLVIFSISIKANEKNEIFDKLNGNWKGTGVVSGMNSIITMEWKNVMNDKFYRLTFRNEMSRENDHFVFEGTAFYKTTADSETEGYWFDSMGLVRPIKAILDTDSIIANWGSKDTEEGKTSYRIIDADSMEVVDFVKTKTGIWREFGRSNFKRVK